MQLQRTWGCELCSTRCVFATTLLTVLERKDDPGRRVRTSRATATNTGRMVRYYIKESLSCNYDCRAYSKTNTGTPRVHQLHFQIFLRRNGRLIEKVFTGERSILQWHFEDKNYLHRYNTCVQFYRGARNRRKLGIKITYTKYIKLGSTATNKPIRGTCSSRKELSFGMVVCIDPTSSW
jgi:hypothetical protein